MPSPDTSPHLLPGGPPDLPSEPAPLDPHAVDPPHGLADASRGEPSLVEDQATPTVPVRATPEEAALVAEPRTLCRNCGARLPGAYCARCGQRHETLRIPVHRFIGRSFTELFGLDGRVWRTLGTLLFKPGVLTIEYLRGRRRRSLSPLRVYLASTLLFFFVLSVLDPVGRSQRGLFGSVDRDTTTVAAHAAQKDSILNTGYGTLDDERADVAEATQRLDSLQRRLGDGAAARADLDEDLADAESDLEEAMEELRADSLDRREGLRRARIEAAMLAAMPPDSIIALDDIHGAMRLLYPDSSGLASAPEWFGRSEAIQGIAAAPTETQRRANAVKFVQSTIGYVPTVLFVILPVFALLLKLIYVRRDWFYSEHLVFGLHTHAFAFNAFTLNALLVWAASLDGSQPNSLLGWTAALLLVSIPVYFYVAQKRVYEQGWIKTALKALVLATLYVAVLIGGLVAVFILAAFLG